MKWNEIHFWRDGPKRWNGTLRFEGKNRYFKKLARIGNWKNPLLSLAMRHERLQCLLFAVPPGSAPPDVLRNTSLGPDREAEEGIRQSLILWFNDLQNYPANLIRRSVFFFFFIHCPYLPLRLLKTFSSQWSHSWVELYGTEFHAGEAIQVREQGALPVYFVIEEIVSANGLIRFGGRRRFSLGIQPNYQCHLLGPLGPFQWITQDDAFALQVFTIWNPINGGGELISDRGF